MPAKRLETLAAFVPTPVANSLFTHAVAGGQSPPSPRVHAERLPAAVLFADISGFTALTETLTANGPDGSEELTALLNLYLTGMIAFLKRYDGQIVKFSGDALTALFPAETEAAEAITTATLRALSAAETMQAATASFKHLRSSVGEVSLTLKVAIGAGEVLAAQVGGVFDRWEYVIAGDPLTQVADAERHAQPGTIMLSARAAAYVGRTDVPPGSHLVWRRDERTDALPSPTDLLIRQPALDWSHIPPALQETVEANLRAYVPAAITTRIAAGQDDWLAELRRMTIMFVGVGGIDYNRSDVLDHLQAFVAAAQEIIYRYEGSLNKLSVDDKGTVLLVLFGAPPLAHEDDPHRALACAQALQAIAAQGLAVAPADFGHSDAASDDRPRAPIRMAIGITTDTVFAGPVGSPSRREYTVMGDAVNLAVRFMQAAGAGNILCDTTTATMTQQRWRMEHLPPLTVKGKSHPVEVYRLIGRRAGTPTHDVPPLVNREQEMVTLAQCLDDIRQGASCVVSLVGEGGIGKTRLAYELMTLAHQRRIACLTGAASSTAQQTPYAVWRDVLANYFDLEGLRGAEQRAERVRERIRALDPDLEPRLPLLNDVLDLEVSDTPVTRGMSPRQRRDSLTFFIVELLLDWGKQGGLLVVLEDMHFADSLSWEVALDVARSLTLRPVMLLLIYRPLHVIRTARHHIPEIYRLALENAELSESIAGQYDAPQQAFARFSQYHELQLAALNQAEVARLAAHHLDNLPIAPHLAEWLTERSQGNPFFVEETIKILHEDGVLRLNAAGMWEFANEHQLTAIPPTLKGVIQARLDRLAPELQLTCKVAAVVGRVFPARVVAGIYPILEQQADPLQHLEILAELDITPIESPEPERSYQFKNALTQEVAYTSLLLVQRQALHQAVAEWYEQEYAADLTPYVPLIADHYNHTHQWHKRLEFSERAGRLAAARYATTEALTYFSHAIDVLRAHPGLLPHAERNERLLELLLCRSELYEQNGNYGQQEYDLRDLSQLVEVSGNVKHQAWVQTRWASYYHNINDYAAAERAAKSALMHAEAISDRRLIGESLNWLARTAELRADYHQALWWGAQALSNCRLAGDRLGEANSLSFIGSGYAELGDYDKASQYHHRALVIRREIEDRWGEAASLDHIGNVAHNLGQPQVALKAYREAIEIRRQIGDRTGAAASSLHIGSAYQALGDLSVAQAYQYEALKIWKALGNQYGEAQLLVKMSSIATTLGDFNTARRYAGESIDLARALGIRQIEGYGLDALGNASRGLGDVEAAYEQHSAAYELARKLRMRRLEAYAHHHLGEWAWEREYYTTAINHWAVAAAIREEIGEDEFARASRTRQARALAILGDVAGARALADEVWKVWGTNPPPGEHEDELREAYLALYATWLQLNEAERAAAALAWAYQAVQDRAVRISDPDLRQSFLTQVTINQAIIRAWNTGSSEEGYLMKMA